MEPIINLKTATFSGSKGQRIFYRNWRNDNRPKAIILIVHGLVSHSGYYDNFARQLVESSYEAYALDLPGRGKSDGERFYIEDYRDVTYDIDQLYNIAASANPGLPVFIFGHSAGGVFASVYAADNQSKLAGLVSESFAFQIPAPGFAIAFIKLLSYIIPHAKLIKLNTDDFSRDRAHVEKLNTDPLVAGEKEPNKTMQQLFAASAYLKSRMPAVELPLLVIHGRSDKATKPEGSKYFADHASSADKKLNLYEGYYHDMLNDKGSGMVARDIINWLNERV